MPRESLKSKDVRLSPQQEEERKRREAAKKADDFILSIKDRTFSSLSSMEKDTLLQAIALKLGFIYSE